MTILKQDVHVLKQDVHILKQDVGTLKTDVSAMKAHFDATLPHLATRQDVSDAINGMIKWMVGIAIAGFSAFIAISTFVLNNAVPKSAAMTPPPVIISVPSSPAPAATPGTATGSHPVPSAQ